jgi:formate hydrogenlyase subunit 4
MFLVILSSLLQLIFILAFAPLLTGIIKKAKALSQHRRGCSVFQVYYDIARLFNKEVVKSNVTSIIYELAPYVVFITSIIAAMCLPMAGNFSPLGVFGDGIFVVYILVLGRIFIALAALDAGSTFGGMGSSREMFIASLVEPAFIMILFTLGSMSGETSLNFMPGGSNIFTRVFLSIALFIVLTAETSRIPVDDPATHLELTMVHEAMILEYSGRQLALVEWAVSIKQFFYIGFIANVLMSGLGIQVNTLLDGVLMLGILGIKSILITIVVAFTEIRSVKTRFFNIPNLTTAALVFSLIGFILSYI